MNRRMSFTKRKTDRVAWSLPFSRRERLILAARFAQYDLREWWRYGLWAAIANRLPGRLVYAVQIRAASDVCRAENVAPDALTFENLLSPFSPAID